MSESTSSAPALQLDAKAIAEIKRLIAAEKLPDTTGVRIGVRGGGCSGFTYTLGFDEKESEQDIVIEQDGVRIFCDAKSIGYLNGTRLQFSDGLTGKGFHFVNPNATSTCGCGESFGV